MFRLGQNSNLLVHVSQPPPLPLGTVSFNGHILSHQFSANSFLARSWLFIGADKYIYTVKYAVRSLLPLYTFSSWNGLVRKTMRPQRNLHRIPTDRPKCVQNISRVVALRVDN
jgi:hypothetical protein